MRPRISLEETTPLHKQRNCRGVRACIAGEERKRKRGGSRPLSPLWQNDFTRRGESAERKRKFPRRPCCIYVVASLFLPFIREFECAQESARTHACIVYTRDDLRFPRGARKYENTYTLYIVRPCIYCTLLAPTWMLTIVQATCETHRAATLSSFH